MAEEEPDQLLIRVLGHVRARQTMIEARVFPVRGHESVHLLPDRNWLMWTCSISLSQGLAICDIDYHPCIPASLLAVDLGSGIQRWFESALRPKPKLRTYFPELHDGLLSEMRVCAGVHPEGWRAAWLEVAHGFDMGNLILRLHETLDALSEELRVETFLYRQVELAEYNALVSRTVTSDRSLVAQHTESALDISSADMERALNRNKARAALYTREQFV